MRLFFLMFNLMLHVHACATFNFCNEDSTTYSICNVHVFCAFNLMVKIIIKLHLHAYYQEYITLVIIYSNIF